MAGSSLRKPEKIKEVFRQYDTNGDGSITCEELQHVLKSLGNFTNAEIHTVFAHVDKNKDGALQFDEFVDWITGSDGQHARAKVALAPSTGDGMEVPFVNFCGAGYGDMDCRSFTKLCKDLHFIDKHLTAVDTDLIFSKVAPKGKRRIDLQHFEAALQLIAERKRLPLQDIRERVIESTRPTFHGTRAEAVRFHDDRSSYTGTHSLRRGSAGSHAPGDARGDPRPSPRAGPGGPTGVPPESPPRRATHDGAHQPSSPLPAAGAPAAGALAPTQGPLPQAAVPATPQQLPPVTPRGPRSYKDVFRIYCGGNYVDMMDSHTFAKLCKDSRLLNHGFVAADADLIFAKVVDRGSRRIHIKQFEEALYQVAEKKGKPYTEILEAVAASSGPEQHSTRAAAPHFHTTSRGSHLVSARG